MVKPSAVTRSIDPNHLKRASKVEDQMVGPYLDSIVLSLHSALDAWRFGKGPSSDVTLALDAFLALYTEADLRGMT